MRTLKFKSQPTNAFFAAFNQMLTFAIGGSSRLPTQLARDNEIVVHSTDNETVLGSSRKLGGPAKHLIDDSEKRICRSTFEFSSPHVIEKRSNTFRNFNRSLNKRLLSPAQTITIE